MGLLFGHVAEVVVYIKVSSLVESIATGSPEDVSLSVSVSAPIIGMMLAAAGMLMAATVWANRGRMPALEVVGLVSVIYLVLTLYQTWDIATRESAFRVLAFLGLAFFQVLLGALTLAVTAVVVNLQIARARG